MLVIGFAANVILYAKGARGGWLILMWVISSLYLVLVFREVMKVSNWGTGIAFLVYLVLVILGWFAPIIRNEFRK